SMKDFGFTLLMHNPDGVLNPQVGTTDLDGDFAGTDTSSCAGFPDLCDRPLFPALFITDITNDPTSKAGDWQSGVIDPQTAAAAIQQGHVYRVQFMVHDGDQNKVGGDTGEGCATVFVEETATP